MYGPAIDEEKKRLEEDPALLEQQEAESGDRTGALKGQGMAAQLQAVSTANVAGNQTEVARAKKGFSGQAKELPHKAALEQHFGRSLDGVQAYTDQNAKDASRGVGANAFAMGNKVAFGTDSPDLELAKHEVTHVLQQAGGAKGPATNSVSALESEAQGGGGAISASPVALMKDETKLLDEARIQKAIRYNKGRKYGKALWTLIQAKLGTGGAGEVSQETVLAVAQWQKDSHLSVDGMVGPSTLAKLDVGGDGGGQEDKEEEKEEGQSKAQTFEEGSMDDMKSYHTKNATGAKPDACIVAMNKGLRKLYGQNMKLGSTVQDTMGAMQKMGGVSDKKVVEFLDEKGRRTTGVTEPKDLPISPAAWLTQKAAAEPGWHVFGMSLMDGYHSITVSVDSRDPADVKIYWSDQWSSHGGFKQFSASDFDDKIKNLTNSWWNSFKKEKGYAPRSRLTFWKLQALK